MIDRRTILAGSVLLGATSRAWGRPASAGTSRSRAIDGIALPANFNGLIAHARAGRVEHVRCVGMADIESAVPITPTTQFRWGSASKWLTSVAVLRLAERGVLSIDAPIKTYLPDFRHDTGDRVLLRHLLSNTSGVPDLLSRELASEPGLRTSSATAAAMVARFGAGDPTFAPGQGWDYAALNWVIVAAIVERLTGTPLAANVERLVLRALGMTGAGFAQDGQPPMPRLAVAYGSAVPPVRKMSPAPAFVAATGNVAGGVRDAVRAAHGIFHTGLLRAPSRTALTQVAWPAQEYALGGRVHLIDGAPWAWETGKVGGYRTHIAHRLARSETIVVFNTTDMDQSAIGAWVETIARA
ncbi:beta-lactamase family protein [Sphingomonas donggukensis]|uniref:Beta-lactamase family protein n=1 Tax=Sphingomonas donggukensis TaxID=2949093 RepID=A0ABY4TTA1_9SPHN|nr:serine hydrolase domain-containing protein [Sphingomonas donggukensis]URW75629.1 beta-lactamase family protein [Sphingomonas donggukensis]